MTGHKQSLTQRTQSNAKHLSCFAEVFVDDTKHGFKIPQSDYFEKGQHVIIDQGDNIIAGYSDRVEGLYTDVPVVVFGDHTRIVKYVDKPFFIGADGIEKTSIIYRLSFYRLANSIILSTAAERPSLSFPPAVAKCA